MNLCACKYNQEVIQMVNNNIQVNQYFLRFEDDMVLMMKTLEVKKLLKLVQVIKDAHDLMIKWLIKQSSLIKKNTFA